MTSTSYPRKPPVEFIDFVMLFLAVASVGLLSWITFFEVSSETQRIIVIADYSVCGIFAVEFGWRWRAAGWPWNFPLRYWYEVIGMIPLSDPAFRAFRLLRVVVILARLGRALDRAYGDRITAVLVGRFASTIVNVIKRPVTVAVLDEVAGVLQKGHYTRNVARALEENRAELDSMIVELIKKDPKTKRLTLIPFHDDIIRLVADTTFRMIFEVLNDPRTDELVSDMLRENVEQIRAGVRGEMSPDGRAAQAVDAARDSAAYAYGNRT